jgi:hypothetical protein
MNGKSSKIIWRIVMLESALSIVVQVFRTDIKPTNKIKSILPKIAAFKNQS